MLLNNTLGDLFALLGAKVSFSIEELRIPLLHLFHLLSIFHLHLHVLLVLQVLQLPHMLLDLERLFFRGDLVLELLFLDLFLHAKVLQLVLDTLLCVRLRQLMVLMELLSFDFVVVVDCVCSL